MTGKIRTTMAASFRFTGDDPDTLVFFAGLGVNSASSCCNTLTKNDQFEKERTVFPSTFAHPQNTEKIRLHYSICIKPLRQWLISQWLIVNYYNKQYASD